MNFCSKYIGISILLVALFLMPGIGNSQAIVTIEQEPVCWTTSGGADSSLTRYVLFSSRTPTAPQVLCYVNASGTIVVPSGGTFAPGWCGCCGDGPATADNDWYFVTGSAISDPIWRSGRVLIGTPDNLPTDTSHQLQLEGDWQFLPDGVGTRFDWQNTTDTTGTAWYGILLSAPAGLGGSSNLSGSRNTFALGTSNTVIDRTRLGVLAFAGNNPNDTDHALGAFMEAVANGAWTSSSTATDLNVWVTASGEIFPRNTVTFQGDGRVELDRYFTFSDGIPQSLLGFDTGPDDITRHPIAGTASPGSTIVVDAAGTGLEWGSSGDGNGIISALPLGSVLIAPNFNTLQFQDSTGGPFKITFKNSSGAIGTKILSGEVSVLKKESGSFGGRFVIIDTTKTLNRFYITQDDRSLIQADGTGWQIVNLFENNKAPGIYRWTYGARLDTSDIAQAVIRIVHGDRYSSPTTPMYQSFIGAVKMSEGGYVPTFSFNSNSGGNKLAFSFDNSVFIRENGRFYIGSDSSFLHDPVTNKTISLGDLTLGYNSENNKLYFSEGWSQFINADGSNGNLTIRNGGGAGFTTYMVLGTSAGIDTTVTIHQKGLGVNAGRSSDIDATLYANWKSGYGVNNVFQLDNNDTPIFTVTSVGQVVVTNTIWLNSAKTLGIFTGTGSPEGVITAIVGSTFHRTNGGAGSTFYVKESGTGNTGWVAK